jgi:hypothetical protein
MNRQQEQRLNALKKNIVLKIKVSFLLQSMKTNLYKRLLNGQEIQVGGRIIKSYS